MQNEKKDYQVLYWHENQWKAAKSDRCLHAILGDRIDIEWEISTGVMKISTSAEDMFSYHKNQTTQVLKFVRFRHGQNCPALRPDIEKNPNRNMKPCACVMLHDPHTDNILVSQRSPNLSFPFAWVLPGGHLEPNETILVGGIRECEQQMGLPSKSAQVNFDKEVMVWESVSVRDSKIRAMALVIFFTAICHQFPVKIMENEVMDYKWKKFQDNSDEKPYNGEEKTGYAQGHRTYLSLVRQH